MKKIFLVAFFMHLFIGLFAQVSDEQVINIVKDAREQGKGQEEIIMILSQKGVTQDQLMRIKSTYNMDSQQSKQGPDVVNRMRKENPTQAKQPTKTKQKQGYQQEQTYLDTLSLKMFDVKPREESKIFGHNIFNNELLTFEPNVNIATPTNYILGPGDEIIIDIWGDTEETVRQYISPDGTLTVPKIGPIYLAGISIKEATNRLKQAFTRIYSSMNDSHPTTFMNLSLGEIRSIRISVMGEVMTPGTYTLPSLASLFHVLYSAGGINDIGSLRSIKLHRANKELANVDIYDYLLKGKSSLDIQLQDGDVIVVSPYQNLVVLEGKVKRPLSYEMLDGETVHDLLDYAGGFKGDAYKEAIRVIRNSGSKHQIYNIDAPDFETFVLTDGDEVSIDSIINRYENKIEIYGAVYRAGLYALGDKISTVKQLIEKAEGVRGDAFLNRAVIYREKADRTLEIVSVDIKGLLENKVEDIKLQKNDKLYIPSIFDLHEEYTITMNGAVQVPGTYKFSEGMSLEDAVIQAGGLNEEASTVKIDVARRIKNPKSEETGDLLAENYTLTLKDGLIVDGEKDFTLMPFDEVYIRKSPMYHIQKNVSVEGQVLYSGRYALSKKGERLSDLVKRAGGVSSDAYVSGARLVRKMNKDERERVESTLKIANQSSKDSIDIKSVDIGEIYYVGIELSKALANPGSEYDVVLREGDILRVPTYIGTVKISGTVMYPNTVVYKKGGQLSHYIDQAGGFGDRAKKRKAFIVYMNGTVSKAKSFGRARIEPGCEIIVPIKSPRKGVGLTEIMSLASSTTSMAAMVTSIMNMTK